jgi:hypothetical protein
MGSKAGFPPSRHPSLEWVIRLHELRRMQEHRMIRKFFATFVSCLLGAAFGCTVRSSSNTGEPTTKDTADHSSWLSVTSSPELIGSFRLRAAEFANREYESLISSVGEFSAFFGPEEFRVLTNRKEETLARLGEHLRKGPTNQTASGAATLLCRLQVPEGRAFVARVLMEASPDTRLQVVNAIDHGVGYSETEEQAYREFLHADDQLMIALLRQLDDSDPKVVTSAIQACGILQIPNREAKFIKLVAQPNVPDRDRIFYWLSKGELTPEILELAVKAHAASTEIENWTLSILEAFAKSDDDSMRTRAKDVLKRYLVASRDDGRNGYRGDRLSALEAFGQAADDRDREWLKVAVESEQGLYAQPLLAALVRIEGSEGKTRLLRLLRSSDKWADAVRVAGDVFGGTSDAGIVVALIELGDKKRDRDLANICNALIAIGGDVARSHVRRYASSLDDLSRSQLTNALDGRSIQDVARRASVLGVIDEHTVETVLRAVQTDSDMQDRHQAGLVQVLEASGILVSFDAESGMLPCRHDLLVQEFASKSRGIFSPEAVSEEWLNRNEQDFDADYVLRFVYGNNAYAAKLRNFGDWYDVERIAAVINRALSDAKHDERFVALATGDQMASFAFAEPKGLETLASEFHVPLSQDLNEARKAGMEFERRALDSYDSARE